MKRYLSILLLALCAIGLQAQPRITHYLCVADSAGNITEFQAATIDSVFFKAYTTYDFVDLGLPSGTLWATCNIGANSPDEPGFYFAWGETVTKSSYTWLAPGDYAHGTLTTTDANFGMTKYNAIDTLTTLEFADDAARTIWQSTWRIPTADELNELLNSCTWTFTTQGGHEGYLVTSNTNANSIFLPCAGYFDGTTYKGASWGHYWSSSLSKKNMRNAMAFIFPSTSSYLNSVSRCQGLSIRPVSSTTPATPSNPTGEDDSPSDEDNTGEEDTPHTPNFNGYDYVDLGLPSGLLWATCNVGAATPDANGYYFAWGETAPKAEYNKSTYQFGDLDIAITKYNTDSTWGMPDYNTVLDLVDDAAHVNWGGDWRMPTKAEMDELIRYCTHVWTELDEGKCGYLLTGPNGNSIYLPCAGYRYHSVAVIVNLSGGYWTSSLCETWTAHAHSLTFMGGEFHASDLSREGGHSVRPVCPPSHQ